MKSESVVDTVMCLIDPQLIPARGDAATESFSRNFWQLREMSLPRLDSFLGDSLNQMTGQCTSLKAQPHCSNLGQL